MIDIKTWNAVQKIVADYAQARTTERHPRRTNSIYLLSGLVYCNECGAPLYGNTVTRQSIHGRDEAYRCSRARRKRDCSAGRISRHTLENAVITTMRELILQPDTIVAMHELAADSRTTFEADRLSRRSTLIAERGKLSGQIVNITKAIADRGALPPLLDKLTELNGRRAQINTELQTISTPLQPLPVLTVDQLKTDAQNLAKILSEAPPETVKKILQSFVSKIRVEKKEKEIIGTVTYYYPPPFDYAPTAPMLSMSSAPVGALLEEKHSRYLMNCQNKNRSL